LLLVEAPYALLALFVSVCCLRQQAELSIPICLQRVGNEPVCGINLDVAATREIGFVAGRLDFLATKPVCLDSAVLEFSLHRQRDLQRYRSDCVDDESSDGLVDIATVNTLASWLGMIDPLSLA
jgi:hypothetical protein